MENYINSDNWTEYSKLMINRPELFINSGEMDIITDFDVINDYVKKNNCKIGVVYQSAYSILIVDLINGPKGFYTYERMIPKVKEGAVVIVPKCEDKYVILKQYRHSLRRFQYAFPRGFGEEGYSASENVVKEVKEELGVEARNVCLLGKVVADSGINGNVVSIYSCVIDLPRIEIGNEGIQQYELLSFEEINKWIKEDKIDDGFTLSAWSYINSKYNC